MKTRSLGTFVISWSQTEVDGLPASPMAAMTVGAVWRWTGAAVRVDGQDQVLRLPEAEGAAEMRRRAARMVRRLIGLPTMPVRDAPAMESADDPLLERGFVVTDGRHRYAITLLDSPDSAVWLCMVVGALPPVDQDLWVVRVQPGRQTIEADPAGAVICFTPETRIATPSGGRCIATLQPGDLILTRDNGPQPIVWIGHRRVSGARLRMMPQLRPIRFRVGALGQGRPDADLLVSPQHRMLVRGRAAQALFNTDEVLVAAQDLLNHRSICIDHALRDVTYVHILLERHSVVWANGLESESFHPAQTALSMIDPDQRADLLHLMPGLADHPHSYGDPARRTVSAFEAALLRHDLVA